MTAITLFVLLALACILIPCALILLGSVLEALPTLLALLACWWLLQQLGCL